MNINIHFDINMNIDITPPPYHSYLVQIFKNSHFFKKRTFKITIRKCVQERKIDANPTHYSKFDKYNVKNKKSKLVRNWYFAFFAIYIYIYM